MKRFRGFAMFVSFAALALAWHTAVPAADAPLTPTTSGWLIASPSELKVPPPPDAKRELAEAAVLAGQRTEAEIVRARWWSAGGPAYRWNEVAIEALLDEFVTLPLAARHLALVHAAIDDAVAAAWANQRVHQRARPRDPGNAGQPVLPLPANPSYPSDYAAAATAAAEVLGYLLPARAKAFGTLAEEAMRSRVVGGVELPSDIAAGREIGGKVASLAIARGRSDGSDAKWTGAVPEGEGRWRGQNPIAPAAAQWRPWVLKSPDEFRPPAPPPFNGERMQSDLAELKAIQRTPQQQHRAVYWEVFGGARAHALWNELARMKLMEHGAAFDAPASARVLATLNIAFADAAVACWDAKYHYWMIRPSQVAADLKTAFPPPNHPSYPAAHGCLSTAAAEVLAAVFPDDRDALLARGKEAAESRVWAGIHYRFDIDAGQALGRNVAAKVLARAFSGPR